MLYKDFKLNTMKAVVPLVILVLASTLTRCSTARVCKLVECETGGGICIFQRCPTGGPKCGDGDSCEKLYPSEWRVCHNGTCIKGRSVCHVTKDGRTVDCVTRGPSCGKNKICHEYTKCVDGTCRLLDSCPGQHNGTSCYYSTGICSNGICKVKCTDSKDCRGLPCVDGECAGIYCGESFCYPRRANN